jgi:REP element-mobilizing transposase RayT
MNRGDHQERIFCDDDDRKMLLATLAEGCDKTGWQIHSYCLMTNHLHLVIETPNANLVEGTKWLLGVVMEARRQAEREQEFKPVPRGWCVGSKQFRAEMLEYIEEQRGKWHYVR